jgi:hypothetical protein
MTGHLATVHASSRGLTPSPPLPPYPLPLLPPPAARAPRPVARIRGQQQQGTALPARAPAGPPAPCCPVRSRDTRLSAAPCCSSPRRTGDVLQDIGSMLSDLTRELDSMIQLEPSQRK